ncbi:MAG: hypothetical protein ACD_80C00131G0017 [uncultured bacterium (gcode 4)]|uniref:Uncharacterized protein n=1 Tax=uncultured bacterium (gcode 4) TaxID=1234023 RepID=K1YI26_9BACT|nr:MAG: hypothetical protein ACD_80C00131G0017 [uncultured bacterium (gcode 4)]
MKKILWTTLFWLVVVFWFGIYVKFFDANIAGNISTWLGTTTVTTSGEIVPTTGTQNEVIDSINTIKTTLTDMQTKLDTLVGGMIPTVTPTPTPVVTTGTGN